MIKENTEPKEEQLVTTTIAPVTTSSSTPSATLISPISTINHTVQQQRMNNNNNNNNNSSYKWKQISLQGLDVSPQLNPLTSPNKISTPPLNSSIQRVSDFLFLIFFKNSFLSSSCF